MIGSFSQHDGIPTHLHWNSTWRWLCEFLSRLVLRLPLVSSPRAPATSYKDKKLGFPVSAAKITFRLEDVSCSLTGSAVSVYLPDNRQKRTSQFVTFLGSCREDLYRDVFTSKLTLTLCAHAVFPAVVIVPVFAFRNPPGRRRLQMSMNDS